MSRSDQRPVAESTFVVAVNGVPDSPPASGLVDFLLGRQAREVTTIFHPLLPEDGSHHTVTTYVRGEKVSRRRVRLPSRPPLTFPIDLLVPLRTPRVDAWFGFNNLCCARGLLERRLGRVDKVIYWAVDFVPDRFGAGSLLTRAYDASDRYCCQHADLRVDLSQAALDGRDGRHSLNPGMGAPRVVAPVGAWLDRVPHCQPDAWNRRHVVFIGHLVERMGIGTAIDAVATLAQRGVDVVLDIAGRGPLEQELREDVERRGLADQVRFHGFIDEHRRLETFLAQAAVGLAPYSTTIESFTRFADPSKLKSYLAVGLPILVTDVPPNAGELAREGGAQVLADDSTAFADAIEALLADQDRWGRRREAALTYARRFDWNLIVGNVLSAAGFQSGTP
jgi:glycosyltransferase involved in cell wall biosynthesis